jgi:hypothetical protein
MASVKISALPVAALLVGGEELPVVQTGATKRTTAQDIANLAPAGPALPLSIGQGGSGQITAQLALDAFFAGVGKGVLQVGDGAHNTALAAPALGQVLTGDPAQVHGMHWTAPPAGSPAGLTTEIQFNLAGIFAASPRMTFDPASGDFRLNVAGSLARVLDVMVAAGATQVYIGDGVGSWVTLVVNGKLGFFSSTPVGQQPANQAMTDATGGVASTMFVDCTTLGLADPAKVNANFASQASRDAEIRALLLAYGLGN